MTIRPDSDLGPTSSHWIDTATYRQAQHVVASHSADSEECLYFLKVLGLDIIDSPDTPA